MLKLKLKEMVFSPSFDNDGNEKTYSEDAYYMSDDMVAVFDGATGLSKRRLTNCNYSDAHWFVKNASFYIGEAYKQSKNPDDILKYVITKEIEAFNKDKLEIEDVKEYELPSSTFLMVSRRENNVFDITNIADGIIMVLKKNGEFISSSQSEFLSQRGRELEEKLKEMVNNGTPLLDAIKIIRDGAREVRNQKNKQGFYGVLDLTYNSLKHEDYKTFSLTLEKGDKIFMSTDGLLRFAESYEMGDYKELFYKSFSSLKNVLENVREFERKDFDCQFLPRFKASDDICAIAIEVE